MDHVDRAAHRVSLSALAGLLGGLTFATFKGLPQRATALKAASSCAIVGSAVFGAERLAYVVFEKEIDSRRRLLLTSHAFSGLAGGGLAGYLYQKRPLRGMFFFLPVMMGVGFFEILWEEKRELRIKEYIDGQEESSTRKGEANEEKA